MIQVKTPEQLAQEYASEYVNDWVKNEMKAGVGFANHITLGMRVDYSAGFLAGYRASSAEVEQLRAALAWYAEPVPGSKMHLIAAEALATDAGREVKAEMQAMREALTAIDDLDNEPQNHHRDASKCAICIGRGVSDRKREILAANTGKAGD